MLNRLSGAQISPEAVHQAAEAQTVAEPSAAQVRKQREIELRRRGMEGKVGVIAGEIGPVGKHGRPRVMSRRYVATFEPASVLGSSATRLSVRLGLRKLPDK